MIPEIFGATIKTRKNQGYYIDDAETVVTGHERLLEAVELPEFLRLPEALRLYMQLEVRQAQGLEYLQPLLQAGGAGAAGSGVRLL